MDRRPESRDPPQAGEVLGLPQGVVCVEMTPLGYPDEEPRTPGRKELSEFVFRDKHGQT